MDEWEKGYGKTTEEIHGLFNGKLVLERYKVKELAQSGPPREFRGPGAKENDEALYERSEHTIEYRSVTSRKFYF